MALTKQDLVDYLANIVSIMRADGQLSAAETQTLAKIQKRIGAKKADLAKATSLTESPTFKLKPVGHFSDQVQNLEDLIVMSITEKEEGISESQIISEFAKTIGITEEQLNRMINDARSVMSASEMTKTCPTCSQQIPSDAKFCLHCGSSLSEKEAEKPVAISYEIPTSGIAIEFAESGSSGFSDALAMAAEAPIQASCIKAKKTWHLASWPLENLMEASCLAINLKGMRNRKVYVGGKELNWEEVFSFLWCMQRRESAYRPAEYCFGLDEKRLNIWGCKQAQFEWAEWAKWFSYGSYKGNEEYFGQVPFVFDKARIKHELDTNLFRFRYCPYLNATLVVAVINLFPDKVYVSADGPWVFKRDFTESPGSIKIKLEKGQGDITFSEEYYSSGVVPKGYDKALEILQKAFSNCSITDPAILSVLQYKG